MEAGIQKVLLPVWEGSAITAARSDRRQMPCTKTMQEEAKKSIDSLSFNLEPEALSRTKNHKFTVINARSLTSKGVHLGLSLGTRANHIAPRRERCHSVCNRTVSKPEQSYHSALGAKKENEINHDAVCASKFHYARISLC